MDDFKQIMAKLDEALKRLERAVETEEPVISFTRGSGAATRNTHTPDGEAR